MGDARQKDMIAVGAIGDRTIEIGPGDAACVPRGQIHGLENHGNVDATFLAMATPAVFGPAYFREVGDCPCRHRRRFAGPCRDRRGDASPRAQPRRARRELIPRHRQRGAGAPPVTAAVRSPSAAAAAARPVRTAPSM